MQYAYLRSFAQQHLSSGYLEATQLYLQQETPLLEDIASHLESITTAALDPKQLSTALEPVLSWVQHRFREESLWVEVAQAFWVNLLAWTLQNLEPAIGESVILEMGESPFKEEVWEQFFNRQVLETKQILDTLEANCAHAVAIALLPSFQSSFPAESAVAQTPIPASCLTIPLWATIHPTLASERLSPSTADSANSVLEAPPFEYTLTDRHDLETLPWRITEHLLNHFHPSVAQLHVISTAHAFQGSVPWQIPVVLKASQILEQRAFTTFQTPSEPLCETLLLHSLKTLAGTNLTCLWLNSEQMLETPAVSFRGKLWDILLESHGQVDWTIDAEIALSELYITLRPSLWVTQFLNQSNDIGTQALRQFGTISQALLERDRLADIPFLKLLCHLFVDLRLPDSYSVEQLMEAAFGLDTLTTLLTEQGNAPHLWSWWNTAISSLGQFGWHPSDTETPLNPSNCYPSPYPSWLDPDRNMSKPQDWLTSWLQQSITLLPPTQSSLMQSSSSQGTRPSSQNTLRLRQFNRLTGNEIRAARKAKQWTQVQLAQALDVHPSLIAKIETGQRSITDTMDMSLRKLFQFHS